MNINFYTTTILLSTLWFVVTSFFSYFKPGLRPKLIISLSVLATGFGLFASLVAGYGVYTSDLIQIFLVENPYFEISLRLDSLSVIMFSMISIIGFVVMKFSFNYLDGDNRQGIFLGRLALTIASVQFLVLSGSLLTFFASWVLTSICLHRLLVFYPERIGARVSAKKKFWVARLSDMSLLVAFTFLFLEFGNGNLEMIFSQIKSVDSLVKLSGNVSWAALFIAFAAFFKSAQLPTHGWLIEVMETPTPVSALLHAGLLNAGPFLLIRMSNVLETSSYVLALIIAVGGITALYGTLANATQTSIKTSLGYSSVAHMGFSIMVCGIGVYPAAMLHLVGHSFYKAHSFLSSGSAIEVYMASRVSKSIKQGSILRIGLGALLALVVFSAGIYFMPFDPQDLGMWMVSAFVFLGIASLMANSTDVQWDLNLVLRTLGAGVLVTAMFFGLEYMSHAILSSQVPPLRLPTTLHISIVVLLLFAFSTVIFIQQTAAKWQDRKWVRVWSVHFRNGLYLNAVFDRIIGTFSLNQSGLEEEEVMYLDLKEEKDPSIYSVKHIVLKQSIEA